MCACVHIYIYIYTYTYDIETFMQKLEGPRLLLAQDLDHAVDGGDDLFRFVVVVSVQVISR